MTRLRLQNVKLLYFNSFAILVQYFRSQFILRAGWPCYTLLKLSAKFNPYPKDAICSTRGECHEATFSTSLILCLLKLIMCIYLCIRYFICLYLKLHLTGHSVVLLSFAFSQLRHILNKMQSYSKLSAYSVPLSNHHP